jgi:hypothetical protein
MTLLLMATVEPKEVGAIDALTLLLSQWKIKGSLDFFFFADDRLVEGTTKTSRRCAEFSSRSDAEALRSKYVRTWEGCTEVVDFEILRKLHTPEISALNQLF